MAADKDDAFKKVGRSTATTLSSPGYTISNTSINVASTSNWPTDTGVTFAIDEVDSDGARINGTYNIFKGVVSSATQITSVEYVGGDANRDYSAGATTRVYIDIDYSRHNEMIDGIVAEHNQDGTHSDITATSLSTDTITEKTAASGVTVDGLNIKDSKLNTNNSVVTANITNGAVTAPKMASNAAAEIFYAFDSAGKASRSYATVLTKTFTPTVTGTAMITAGADVGFAVGGTTSNLRIYEATAGELKTSNPIYSAAAEWSTAVVSGSLSVTAGVSYTITIRQNNSASNYCNNIFLQIIVAVA